LDEKNVLSIDCSPVFFYLQSSHLLKGETFAIDADLTIIAEENRSGLLVFYRRNVEFYRFNGSVKKQRHQK